MRSVGRRKARNQPCKSPSPDIANHNIIKHTCIQVQDIKKKLKQAQQKSMKMELQSSDSYVVPSEVNTTLELKYRQVYEDFNRLKKEYGELKDDHLVLREENQKLKGQRQVRLSSIISTNQQVRQETTPLRQKVTNSEGERRSLIQDLNLERYKNQNAQRAIEQLKTNEYRLNQEINRLCGMKVQQQGNVMMLSRNMTNLQKSLNSKINELTLQVNQIKTLERVIQQKQSRLFGSNHPKTPSTAKQQFRREMTNSREYEVRSELYASPQYKSRIQQFSSNDRVGDSNFILKEEIRNKKYEIQRLKEDNFELQRRLHDAQNMNERLINMSTPKFTQTDINNVFEQYGRQNMTASDSLSEVNRLKTHNRQLEQKLTAIEADSLKQRTSLLQMLEHHKKLLKVSTGELQNQQCQICSLKDKEIDYLKQLMENNEKKYRQNLNQMQQKQRMNQEEFKQKIKETEKRSDKEVAEWKQKCQEGIQENKDICSQLQSLKERVNVILGYIHVDEANKLLDENYQIFCDLETNNNAELEQYNKTLTIFRQKLFSKEQQNAHLQSQLSLRTKEIQLLKVQIKALRDLNQQHKKQHYEITTSTLKRRSSREKIELNGKFRKNQLSVLDQLKDGSEKLTIICKNVISSDIKMKQFVDDRGQKMKNS